MQLRNVIVNGQSFTISAQANSYLARYCAKRSQADAKPLAKSKIRSLLNTGAAKAPAVKNDEGIVEKLYKRCKAGKHEICDGKFGTHSVCTCDCHKS